MGRLAAQEQLFYRFRISYETNYLVDDRHAIIVDVEASPARLSQEIVAAKTMLARSGKAVGFEPASFAAEKSYGTAPFSLPARALPGRADSGLGR